MHIFFDTEFTGLHQNTTLISIGLISEDGKSFYAEFSDYDRSQCDEWINENILANLSKNVNELSSIADINVDGDKEEIKNELLKWMSQFDIIEWVADVCHYDFMLLINLLYGEALNMPSDRFCAACHDINQDIASYYKISEIEAFNMSREAIVIDFNDNIGGTKHNALYDAFVAKSIYDGIVARIG